MEAAVVRTHGALKVEGVGGGHRGLRAGFGLAILGCGPITATDEAKGAKSENEGTTMANWETCLAVERHPLRVSGAWVFKGTRVPVSALFENLKAGASIEQFLEWFQGVERWKVETVLDHELRYLAPPASARSSEQGVGGNGAHVHIVRSRLYQAEFDPAASEEGERLRTWLGGHE